MRLPFLSMLAVVTSLGQINPAPKAIPQIKLWAALGVTRPVFQLQEMQHMSLSLVVVNDSQIAANPRVESSHLFINGVEPKDWGFVISNGLRSPDFESLAPGRILSFGYELGPRYFSLPGIYSVRWEGPDFKSAEITFRVMPAAGN
jgi:hypothetical protein